MTRRRRIIFRSGGPAFAPTDIANLIFWYDASDEATITETAGEVSAWADKSLSSIDLSQGTASRQPNTNTINGNVGIFFDDTDFLSASSVSITHTTLTMVVVFTPNVAASSDYILSGTVGGTSSRFDFSMTASDTVQSRVFVTAGSFSSPVVNTGALAGATRGVIGRHQSSTTGRVEDDQGTEGTDASVGTLYTSSDTLIIGAANTTPSLHYNGTVHEIFAYNAYLTDEEVATLFTYITGKWTMS